MSSHIRKSTKGGRSGAEAAVLRTASLETSADAEIRLGRLDEFVGFHLRLAQEASFAAFAKLAGKLDVGPGRFAILALIGENPGLTQTALGAAAGRDKSTLTPALDDLERRGLILRRRAPTDRRSYALALTPKGQATLRKLMACAEAHERELDRLVGSEDKAKFVRTLQRIAAARD